MAEANGALVSLYVQRNNAIKNKGDVAGLNAEINKYVEDKEVSAAVRRASSAAASNVQSNSKGADIKKKTKKVPVISIGVGMAEMPKSKKNKAAMMRGGMANGKEHMYAAGGSVNDGLKALAKTRPDVVAKILK
tara:strand:+ start:204 stop:605 length:402 start_codon:yes stop_codon:yes gene_type:complete